MRPLAPFMLVALVGTGLGCGFGPKTTAAAHPTDTVAEEAESSGLDNEEFGEILDEYVASFGKHWGDAYRFSGFILVTRGGEPVYAKGFGIADRVTKSVPTADTTFRIGSVTKQFTAAAILELQEQGKLNVEDSVRDHLPDYPEIGDAITVHQLLTHTAGVSNYTSDAEWMETDAAKPHTTGQMLATFQHEPLDFEPGEEFRYSNSGYVCSVRSSRRYRGRATRISSRKSSSRRQDARTTYLRECRGIMSSASRPSMRTCSSGANDRTGGAGRRVRWLVAWQKRAGRAFRRFVAR